MLKKRGYKQLAKMKRQTCNIENYLAEKLNEPHIAREKEQIGNSTKKMYEVSE